jgi:hypothetical protein
MSVYLKPEFNKILSLLEMKIDPVLFTDKYKEVRGQISGCFYTLPTNLFGHEQDVHPNIESH